VAVVSLKEGATSTDDDIYKLGVQLLGNKAPRKIIITNEFPMSGLGKVDHDKIMSIINRYKVITESFDKKSLPRINSNKRLAADLTVSLLQIRLENLSNKLLAISELSRWSPFLLPPVQSEYESDFGYCGFLDPIDEADRSFIEFLVRLTKVLLTEGKVPCFSDILIKSVKCENNDQSTFGIALQIPIVDNIPLIIYKSTFEFSAALCGWISENSPTSENKTKVFNKILEKVIKPLHKLIPAGKSTIPVLKVAHSLGIPFMHLGAGVYQLGWGSKARRLDRSSSELDSAMGAKLAQNKVVAANLLRLAGLPAPSHAVVKNESEALAAADRLGLPVVIKPTDRDRGEGVSVDVVNSEGIKQAFSHARELSKSKQVLVERQVSGVCHRLFIANGHLLYAVKRLPMSVRGDGRRTVAQLVDDEVAAQNNKAPWVRSEIQPIDERALKALASAGLSLQSIPKEGAWAPLRRIESTADGGIDEEVTTIIHPENLSAAIAAAKFFGLHVAGIDIISPDISKPWHENGAIINEVNFAPLFGGGEISRSHIPRFFADFIDGDGKIPIEAFDTEEAAIAKQAAYQRQGLRCYFTTSATTIDFSGKPLSMPFNDAKQRVKALICRSDVDAITVYLPRTKA
jgi:cyanophycin synthetase